MFSIKKFFLFCMFFGVQLFATMNNVIDQSFVPMKGITLSKKEILLPDYFKNRVTLVAFGFSKGVQNQFDSWINPFIDEFGESVFFLEIPMMGRKYRFFRSFIDGGMRSGISTSLHDHVMCFYDDTDPYLSFYGFPKKEIASFVLVDQYGKIRWQYDGMATAESFQSLITKTKELL